MCVSPVYLIKGRESGHKSFLEMPPSQYTYDWSRLGQFHETCVGGFYWLRHLHADSGWSSLKFINGWLSLMISPMISAPTCFLFTHLLLSLTLFLPPLPFCSSSSPVSFLLTYWNLVKLTQESLLSCSWSCSALIVTRRWVCQQTQNFALWRRSPVTVALASTARRMLSTNLLTSNPGENGKVLYVWRASE